MATVQYSVFYVGDRPRAFWDPELGKKNLGFLRGIDPSYYSHISKVHEPLLKQDSRLQAATALRIAYSQGLETLMALACAAMQAPDCILGWMLLYKNHELRSLVASISGQRDSVLVHPWYSPPSWNLFARRMLGGAQCEEELRSDLETKFARLFSGFASDFLDDRREQEYNALKHGARPRLGGFHMSIGEQPDKGTPASPEDMVSLGGSEFGSAFFAPERVGADKLHLRPVKVAVNWVPENLVEGLLVLEIAIGDLVSFLRAQAGEPIEDCPLTLLKEDFMYELPWAKSCGITTGSFRLNFDSNDVADWNEDDLRRLIDERWTSS